jgi:hypothetical protein
MIQRTILRTNLKTLGCFFIWCKSEARSSGAFKRRTFSKNAHFSFCLQYVNKISKCYCVRSIEQRGHLHEKIRLVIRQNAGHDGVVVVLVDTEASQQPLDRFSGRLKQKEWRQHAQKRIDGRVQLGILIGRLRAS